MLRLYPKSYREHYGESMEQTFNDLLRERTVAEKKLLGFSIRIFVETFVGAMRENMEVFIMRFKIMQNTALVRIALVTACILLVPLLAMQFTSEVAWNLADFVVAGILLFGAGLTYELIARKADRFAYRIAVGIAVAAALLLIWINLAVGIIGDEGNPANLMYIGVLAVGIIGAVVARFQPRGMAHALVATAIAQCLVALIALFTGLGYTIVVTAIFVTLWLLSAWLFRKSCAEVPHQ